MSELLATTPISGKGGRRSRFQERLLLWRVTGLDLAAALQLGVELGPEEHGDVRDPQPHQEGDHAAGADPTNARLLDVGGSPLEDGEHQADDHQQHRHLAMPHTVTAVVPMPSSLAA